MISAPVTQPIQSAGRESVRRLPGCATAERVVIGYFGYTAVLGLVYGLLPWQLLAGVCAPLALAGLAWMEAANRRAWTRHLRDWLIPLWVLGGYWQMGWFAGAYARDVERKWLGWDRAVLEGIGLRGMIEWTPGVAWWLELSYLLLYGLPAMCIGVLYWRGARGRIQAYLGTFALGTLMVYAMLPLVPVESPRTAFAGMDAPGVASVWRSVNLWILDRMDIATSVFPSGHVAVAFSSALGMRRALPEWRWGFGVLLFLACSVFVATVYGRYHYGVDGLASVAVSLSAWAVLEAYDRVA
jgi:membrane-associated phospholipid phosphatase